MRRRLLHRPVCTGADETAGACSGTPPPMGRKIGLSNILRVYGQFSIETIHERRKRLAYSNRKTKCQNYRK